MPLPLPFPPGMVFTLFDQMSMSISGDFIQPPGPPPPPPLYPGPVALRSNINTILTPVTTPYMSRKFFVAADDITALQVAFPNWSNNGGFVETPSGGVLSVTASIEYPAGTFTQLTFKGATTGTVLSGQTLWSDFLTLGFTIPRLATAYLRWFASNTVKMPVGTGVAAPFSGAPQYVAGGDACVSNGTDQTMSGAVVDDGTGVILWPAAIIGLTSRPTFAIIGDSRAAGVTDTADATGGTGELERELIRLGYGYINVAVPGDRVVQFIANSSRRMALARMCSHIIVQGSINDISAGQTAAQLLANRQTLRNLAPNRTFFGCTIAPKSTSSDGFATVANQTVDVNNGVRQTVNAAVRAVETGYASPPIDIASFVESGGAGAPSGKWKAPGYAYSDGNHELQAANLAITPLSFGTLTTRAWDVMDSSPILRLRGDLGVTAAGGIISAWTDQSPAAIAATASGALQPTAGSAINSKATIHFNGSQALSLPSFNFIGPKTVVVIMRRSVTSNVEDIPLALKSVEAGGPWFNELQFSNSGGYRKTAFAGDFISGVDCGFDPTIDTLSHSFIFTYDSPLLINQPSSYTMKLDGIAQVVTVNGAASASKPSTDPGSIGGRLSSVLALSNAMTGDIGEIIVYPRVLSAVETTQLISYISSYWGI